MLPPLCLVNLGSLACCVFPLQMSKVNYASENGFLLPLLVLLEGDYSYFGNQLLTTPCPPPAPHTTQAFAL